MSEFQVPHREVRARLHRRGSEPVEGHFFVPESADGGAVPTLCSRLNDPGERFLAFSVGGESTLVARAWVLRVEILDTEDANRECADAASDPISVSVVLSDGQTVAGTTRYVSPPGQGRAIDFLNRERGFVPIETQDGVSLVHLDHVVAWRD